LGIFAASENFINVPHAGARTSRTRGPKPASVSPSSSTPAPVRVCTSCVAAVLFFVSVGLLPQEGKDLVLVGAILSILLNPVMFTQGAEVIIGNAVMAEWQRPAHEG